MVLKYRENYMTESAAQEKSKLYFVFPNTTDAETVGKFDINELQITPAMFPKHILVVSTLVSEHSEDFLNKVGPGINAINNTQNLLNLEAVFTAINKSIRAREFHGAVSLFNAVDNTDGSKTVNITQCVGVKVVLNNHNFFFKIFLKITPFTAFIDQETGKLVAEQETIENITVTDVLEPELYVTDNHGNQYHPETFFNMRVHGVRNPDFNLEADALKRGVTHALMQDQSAWVTIVRYGVPQILEKIAVA